MIPVAVFGTSVANSVATIKSVVSIPSLSETSTAVYALVNNLSSKRKGTSDIIRRLKCMDLDARAKIIGALVKDLSQKDDVKCESIVVARSSLKEAMLELKNELEAFDKLNELYAEAWFPYWRYNSAFEVQLDTISDLSDLLKTRLNSLVQLLPLLNR